VWGEHVSEQSDNEDDSYPSDSESSEAPECAAPSMYPSFSRRFSEPTASPKAREDQPLQQRRNLPPHQHVQLQQHVQQQQQQQHPQAKQEQPASAPPKLLTDVNGSGGEGGGDGGGYAGEAEGHACAGCFQVVDRLVLLQGPFPSFILFSSNPTTSSAFCAPSFSSLSSPLDCPLP